VFDHESLRVEQQKGNATEVLFAAVLEPRARSPVDNPTVCLDERLAEDRFC
jgi:hypothetical protein